VFVDESWFQKMNTVLWTSSANWHRPESTLLFQQRERMKIADEFFSQPLGDNKDADKQKLS